MKHRKCCRTFGIYLKNTNAPMFDDRFRREPTSWLLLTLHQGWNFTLRWWL